MDDKTLLHKRRQRAGIRSSCTKEVQKAASFLEDATVVDVQKVQTSIGKLNDYRSRLDTLDNEINIEIDDATDAEAEQQQSAEYDDTILEMVLSLGAKLEKLQSAQLSEHFASLAPGGSQHSVAERRLPSVKLPKLELDKFNGNPLKWQEFWDSYDSTIHQNATLSDIDKFKYLRSFLTNDALRLVDGYRLTSANYDAAIQSLTERFGNKQLAIFSHFETMLALPSVNHDTHRLQYIYDECEKHIRSLVALGLAEDTFGQVFTPIILSKLPMFVKMELHRKNGSDPWLLSNLRAWLKEEIRARDMSQRTFGGSPSHEKISIDSSRDAGKRQNHVQSRPSPPFQRLRYPQGTSSSLLANDKSKTRCTFCTESHFADQCKKYPDVNSRKQQIRAAGRCFVCFGSQHSVKNCPQPRPCVHCNKAGHHRSLCFTKFGFPNPKPSDITLPVAGVSTALSPINTSLLTHGERVILQTAVAPVRGQSFPVKSRILFDTGSSRSFITSDLCRKVSARPKGKEVVSIAGFSDSKRRTETYKTVELDVLLVDGRKQTITANVIDNISCPIQVMPLDTSKYPFIKQMALAEPLMSTPQMVTIDILLGLDYYYDFIGVERFKCSDGVVFLSSSLGFVATGRVEADVAGDISSTALTCLTNQSSSPDSTLHIERFWSLEDIGVKSPKTTNDDEDALKSFNDSVEFVDDRYHVDFPFKADHPELPDNRRLALGRLNSLWKRIGSDESVVRKYDYVIKDQLDKGVVEVAPAVPTSGKVHYLPHHCVVTPNKTTTKLRVVYDASSKINKHVPSLNECLNRGPVMLDDLCGLLIRFRLNAIAIVSDIEKAFLQVGLKTKARDVTRFFWLRDVTKQPTMDNLIIYRFCRVLFGTIASPFLLAAVIAHHLKKSSLPVAKDVHGNVYVDNVIVGKNSIDDAVVFYEQAKQIFNDASMNLREWYTNDEVLASRIQPQDRGKGNKTKLLGMTWDIVKDTISCPSFDVQSAVITTKRHMLKYLAKVFDPCGYFSPVTVAGKLLIQRLWKENYGWDDRLPDNLINDWAMYAPSLQQIGNHVMPRCYDVRTMKSGSSNSLHCFCDASARAYAAVVYLVTESGEERKSILLFAKSRVGPIKQLSIPRMELMALLVGVRVLSFVTDSLRIPILKKYVWSDSQCVLHWLVKKNVATMFVKNRVSEIKKHKDVVFRYVPTESNPSDLSSRGCSYDAVANNSLWWHGPTWLRGYHTQWPENAVDTSSKSDDEENDAGVEKSFDTVATAVVDAVNDVIATENFSTLPRLMRVTAWVFRFATNARKRDVRSGSLTADDLAVAQLFWEKRIQKEHYSDVLNNKDDRKSKALVSQLQLFIGDDGIIRCGGRIGLSDLPLDAKFPTLLPSSDHFTRLVILDCHQRLFHAGVAQTLAQLRYKYWIIHGRSCVKKVLRGCHLCKLIHAGPFRVAKEPQLPDFRVQRQRPFACVGVDYMGPLHVRSPDDPKVTTKVWVCLFTCSVVRAVHLELVEDMSADQFLMCFRRFIASFGKPYLIVSDNAKYFHASHRFLSRIWRDVVGGREVQDYSATQGIKWKFIPELAPWMGGFYERLIGVAKKALKKSLDRRCVSMCELRTVLVEVCAVVNARPLVYPESDVSQPPLSPAHFLGGPHCGLPQFDLVRDEFRPFQQVTSDGLVNRWKRLQSTVDSFWENWRGQYLLSLRTRSNHTRQRNAQDVCASVGAVVIVKDNLPRNEWKLGVIVRLHSSRDGTCRSATVRLSNRKHLKRALKMLYPLEISAAQPEVFEHPKQSLVPVMRPQRQAAMKARQAIVAENQLDSESESSISSR